MEQRESRPEESHVQPQQLKSTDWRNAMSTSERLGLINTIIFSILPSTPPGSISSNMPDPILHQDIVNFEDLIFNQASSRDTYYKSISDAILNINRGVDLQVSDNILHVNSHPTPPPSSISSPNLAYLPSTTENNRGDNMNKKGLQTTRTRSLSSVAQKRGINIKPLQLTARDCGLKMTPITLSTEDKNIIKSRMSALAIVYVDLPNLLQTILSHGCPQEFVRTVQDIKRILKIQFTGIKNDIYYLTPMRLREIELLLLRCYRKRDEFSALEAGYIRTPGGLGIGSMPTTLDDVMHFIGLSDSGYFSGENGMDCLSGIGPMINEGLNLPSLNPSSSIPFTSSTNSNSTSSLLNIRTPAVTSTNPNCNDTFIDSNSMVDYQGIFGDLANEDWHEVGREGLDQFLQEAGAGNLNMEPTLTDVVNSRINTAADMIIDITSDPNFVPTTITSDVNALFPLTSSIATISSIPSVKDTAVMPPTRTVLGNRDFPTYLNSEGTFDVNGLEDQFTTLHDDGNFLVTESNSHMHP